MCIAEIAVSVIIPVYNAEHYLEDCLNEVTGQTLTNLEIICVDDGSTDRSAQILEDYRQRDSRIHVVRQENQGAGAARNAGLQLASGKYLSFLDADDRFETQLLQAAYEQCEKTGADICAYAADSFDANTGETDSYNAAFRKQWIPQTNPFVPSSEETRETLLQMFNGVPWSKLFRRSFILESGLRFQTLRTTNDAFFVYMALCKASKIVTLDRILVHRRKNDVSSLTQTRNQSCLCFYEALKAIQEELRRSGLYDTFERSFVNRALQNTIWNADTVSSGAAEIIAAHMQREGFQQFGFDRFAPDFYYDQGVYERYCWMRDLDPGAIRTVLDLAKERDLLKHENRKLLRELEAVSGQKQNDSTVTHSFRNLFRKR